MGQPTSQAHPSQLCKTCSRLWVCMRPPYLRDPLLSTLFFYALISLISLKYASVKFYLIAPLLAHKYLLSIYYMPSKWK